MTLPAPVENKERTPSPYQQTIYNAVQFDVFNIFVDAVAGSGKTTTLEGICRRLTESQLRSSIFLAFNKAIQVELSKRLPKSVWVRTFHSVGMYNLRIAIKPTADDNSWVQPLKYRAIIDDYMDRRGYFNEDDRAILSEALTASVHFSRLTLCDLDDETEFHSMCDHYGIEMVEGLNKMTKAILKRGEQLVKQMIDYVDMIYVPIRMNIRMRQFMMLMVDEAQDLSKCQRELMRRMMYRTSRVIAVGDPYQAIYGFAGAGVDSVQKIIEEFKCTVLPLSVCYRCPASHIALVNMLFPAIRFEARPGASVGELTPCLETIREEGLCGITYDHILNSVNAKREDLVICRLNAPLIDLAFKLLGMGVPVSIKGKDLLGQLVTLARQVMKLPGANWAQFQSYLEEYTKRQLEALSAKKDSETAAAALQDKSLALSVVVQRAQASDHRISTIKGLEKFLERVFGPEQGAVLLSSVHKAKGLEADYIFVLGPEVMPLPSVLREGSAWELEQENHLLYVGLTRAKCGMTLVQLPPREQQEKAS